jgi:hypothetical protein
MHCVPPPLGCLCDMPIVMRFKNETVEDMI